MQEIQELFEKLKGNKPLDFLSQFIAPHLVGDEWADIRKAILLMLATQGDKAQRMRLHTLLWGGAGLGKTEIMLWIQENLGGVLVNAEHTSKVGLVGNASANTKGLLADYDGQVLLLDELDKMSVKDQSGLLQAMEEGAYTIVKGRVRNRYNAEVRVLASANDIRKISKPLMDRFDFIFQVKTMPREKRVNGIETIVKNFFGEEGITGVNILKEYLKWIEGYEPYIEESDVAIVVNMLKKYILLTKTAIDGISYRNLELSVLRIAHTMAKLEKSSITAKHIEEAIVFKDRMLRKRVGEIEK